MAKSLIDGGWLLLLYFFSSLEQGKDEKKNSGLSGENVLVQ